MINNAELDDYNLGRLTRIPASAAIGGEATHFTPWLASHIDELAKSIRVGLYVGTGEELAKDILEHTEVAVGDTHWTSVPEPTTTEPWPSRTSTESPITSISARSSLTPQA